MTKLRIVLAFIVTCVIVIIFIAFGVFSVVAAVRWAFVPGASVVELLCAVGAWFLAFAVMQGWSYYMRNASD
jgi:hypothetical protein